MLDPVFVLTLALLLAVLLGHAAWSKLTARRDFAAVLAAYDVLPAALNGLLSVALPVAEAGIAAALLVHSLRPLAGAAAAVLFVVYGTAIAVNRARGRRALDCGCAGPGERRPIAAWMVWRNLVLAAAAALVALGGTDRPLAIADALTVLGAVTGFALLYLALDRLLTGALQSHGVER